MEKLSNEDLKKELDRLQLEVIRLKRAEKINRALFDISATVSSSATLDELYPSIHASLSMVIDATNFYIALFDSSKNIISFPYEVDRVTADDSPIIGATRENSLTARVLQTKKPLLINREQILQERQETGWQILRGEMPDIWLGVPLEAQHNLVGVMAVQSYEGEAFYDENDVDVMTAVAGQVATAINHKQVEEKLKESFDRFRVVIEEISEVGIKAYDEERRVTFWNKASENLFGYSEQEAVGQLLEELIIPETMREQFLSDHENWIRTEDPVPAGELVLMDKNGGGVQVYSFHAMHTTSAGKEFFCIDLDLRQVKRAEEAMRESHAKFMIAMDSLDAVVYAADMETFEIVFVNSKAREVFNADVGDICWATIQSGQSKQCSFCTNKMLVDEECIPKSPYIWEFQNTKTLEWYQCRDQAIRWPDGRLVRLEIATNISKMKRVEEELRDSESRFRALHDASFSGICIHERGRIIECNQELANLTGYSREELFGFDVYSLISPSCHEKLSESVSCDRVDSYFVKGVRKDGTVYDLRLQGRTIPYRGGSARVEEFRDITIRRKAEKAIEESEQKHRIIFESSPLGMIYFSPEGTILDCNEKFVDLMGSSKESLIGFNTAERSSPKMREAIRKALAGESLTFEDFYTSVTGNRSNYIRVSFQPVTPGQSPSNVIATLEDLTERREAEEAVRLSAERFKTFFSAINDAVFVYREKDDQKISEVNEIAIKRYGYRREEFLKMSFRKMSFFNEVVCEQNSEISRGTGQNVFEDLHVKKSGEKFPVEVSLTSSEENGQRVKLAVVRDIAERKSAEKEKGKLEQQLQQEMKLKSIGRLAGGVAHDFNNMLGVILGRTDMIMDEVDESFEFTEDIEEIQRAAERSAELTRQLLTFARKQDVTPVTIDISKRISGMINMLGRLIGERIALVWKPEFGLWPVRIDPSQMDQVLTNLCVNAKDAIKENGIIEISCRNISLSAKVDHKTQEVYTGDFVLLSVKDDGCGMDSVVLKNLFEPFFTTKGIGKGTGLGLSTVYGIAKQNQGFVEVMSRLAEGSVFRVYFPKCETAEKNINVGEVKKEEQAVKGGTILLVEDERAILKMAARMLEVLGYKVLSASGPDEALQIAANYRGEINLLLTDVIMPGMDGRRLAERIKSHLPDILLLFMSGYTDDVLAISDVLEKGMFFIQKPFSKADLANKLETILGGE